MSRDLAARTCMIVDAPEVVAVRHRRESSVERKDLETMPRQIEFTNNFGSQQRYNIRADGKLETGKHLFRNRSTAEHIPALQHEDLFAGARKIRGIHQTVMPASNN